MIVLVTSRIPSTHHIQDIVIHLFGTPGCHIAFALLRDHIRNVSFFRTEIIAHRLGFILLVTIFEKRIAEFLPDRVETESGIHQATVHIHLDFLGLKFDLLIFHIAFPEQISPVRPRHDDGVFRLVGNRSVQPCLLLRYAVQRKHTILSGGYDRIAHNGRHGIGRGNKFLRLSHHVSGEEKQQNNQAFVFQKHSVVICSVLQRANV